MVEGPRVDVRRRLRRKTAVNPAVVKPSFRLRTKTSPHGTAHKVAAAKLNHCALSEAACGSRAMAYTFQRWERTLKPSCTDSRGYMERLRYRKFGW